MEWLQTASSAVEKITKERRKRWWWRECSQLPGLELIFYSVWGLASFGSHFLFFLSQFDLEIPDSLLFWVLTTCSQGTVDLLQRGECVCPELQIVTCSWECHGNQHSITWSPGPGTQFAAVSSCLFRSVAEEILVPGKEPMPLVSDIFHLLSKEGSRGFWVAICGFGLLRCGGSFPINC